MKLCCLLLTLSGCSWLHTTESECYDRKPCPVGYTCNVNTAQCVEVMVQIPAGMALLGNRTVQTGDMGMTDPEARSNEEPLHAVHFLNPYYLDQVEVTLGAYRACVLAGKCTEPESGGFCNWTTSVEARESHPINCVDWNQASAFCSWKNKRLPNEAEWEYAARGAGMSKYPWGNDIPGDQLCWRNTKSCDGGTASCLTYGTCVGGRFPATKLGSTIPMNQPGLYDLAGNVWEWTQTQYCDRSDGAGICNSKYVIRGGSWNRDTPQVVRAAYRSYYDATDQLYVVGFRCAQD